MSTKYDPKSALKVLRNENVKKAVAERRKRGPQLLNKDGAPAYEASAQWLCFPLRAFTEHSTALPLDIQGLERSANGLRTHIRPDGGVYHGLFELPNEPDSSIAVFGDPLATMADAKHTSITFRRRLMQKLEERATSTTEAS